MAGWHHQCNGHELGQTPGDGEGQGSLECYSPWDRKEPDMTEQLNKERNIRKKVGSQRDLHTHVYSSIIHNSQKIEIQCPLMDEWIKNYVIYILLLSHFSRVQLCATL